MDEKRFLAPSDVLPEEPRARVLVALGAVLLGLLSFFALGAWATNPASYAGVIASLDARRDIVLSLVGGSTGASGAITLLPGDVGTPIAEKLLDIAADFGIVLAAIYLEKYLLTIIGWVTFKLLVPLSCVMVAIAALLKGEGVRFRELLLAGAARLTVFGLLMVLVIPASVWVSDMVEATYNESMALAADDASDEADPVDEADPAGNATAEGEDSASSEQEQNSFSNLLQFVQNIPQSLSGAAEDATAQAQETLNTFIETLAMMIVTSCVIPMLTLLFFLWLAKTILGLDISLPTLPRRR